VHKSFHVTPEQKIDKPSPKPSYQPPSQNQQLGKPQSQTPLVEDKFYWHFEKKDAP
jgi:hypothetical protein